MSPTAPGSPRRSRPWVEWRGTRCRARWRNPDTGRPETLASGFTDEAECLAAAYTRLIEIGRGEHTLDGRPTVAQWAALWLPAQDLTPNSVSTYRSAIEVHLLPEFGAVRLSQLTHDRVLAWERRQVRRGYSRSTVGVWMAVLRVMLADAVEAGHITTNPAEKPVRRSRRGRVAVRAAARRATGRRSWARPIDAFLVAERCAAITGRDEEFIQVIVAWACGLRWGETIGIHRSYVDGAVLHLQTQLAEVRGRLVETEPKEGSVRDIDLPLFLRSLLARQLSAAAYEACPCHGHRYVFGGPPGAGGGPHWLRGTATTLWWPAVDGNWGKPKGGGGRGAGERVLVAGGFPGVPQQDPVYAEASWLSVRAGLTRHGLRHGHNTVITMDLRVDEELRADRMGHATGRGVRGTYTHVTPQARQHLLAGLQRVWEETLDARIAIAPSSTVPVVAELLAAHAAGAALRSARQRKNRRNRSA